MPNPSSSPDIDAISDVLRTRAGHYFDVFADATPQIKLAWKSNRPNSSVMEFRMHTRQAERRVIVKVPRHMHAYPADNRESPEPDRPRLYPRAPVDQKGEWEFTALDTIDQYFKKLGDESFGTIRPLERLMPGDIMILEKCPHPSLKTLMTRQHRWANATYFPAVSTCVEQLSQLFSRSLPNNWGQLFYKVSGIDRWASGRSRRDMPLIFERVGMWLRHFHRLPAAPWVRTRNANVEDFREAVMRFAQYLAVRTGRNAFFIYVAAVMDRVAANELPENPPLAVVHGDFAPRNILVSPRNQISVFDTMACWQAPLMEDVAHLCLALRINNMQVSTFGCWHSPAAVTEWEAAFTSGYFGDGAVPWRSLRLFECLLAMERWCALAQRHVQATGSKRWSSKFRMVIWQAYLHRHIHELIKFLEVAPRTNDAVDSPAMKSVSAPENPILECSHDII